MQIADRLYLEAARLLQQSIDWMPYDRKVLFRFAEAICNHYVLDQCRLEDDKLYASKIRAVVARFNET